MDGKIVLAAAVLSISILAFSFIYFLSNEWFFTDPLTEVIAILIPLIVLLFFAFIVFRRFSGDRLKKDTVERSRRRGRSV